MTINPVGVTANPVVTAQTEQSARSPQVAGGSAIPAEPPQVAAARSPEPSLEQMLKAAKQVQEMVQTKANNLVFSVDKDSGKTIVKIVDSQTDEVIRQMPSEEMLELAKSLDDMQKLQGVLLKNKA